MIPALIHLLVWLLVLGVVAWLVIYVIEQLPLPPPFGQVARVVVVVVCCLVLILVLLNFVGMSGPLLR